MTSTYRIKLRLVSAAEIVVQANSRSEAMRLVEQYGVQRTFVESKSKGPVSVAVVSTQLDYLSHPG